MQQLLYVPLIAGLAACAGGPKHPRGQPVHGKSGACALLDAREPGLVMVNHGTRPRTEIELTARSDQSRRARIQWGRRGAMDVEFMTRSEKSGLDVIATTKNDAGQYSERLRFEMTGGAIHLADAHIFERAAPTQEAVRQLLGLWSAEYRAVVRLQHLFPEEAVGPGARWVSTSKDGKQSGTVTEFELVSYADGVATLSARRHSCSRQIVLPPDGGYLECSDPTPPPGIDCFDGIELGETVSTGTLTIDTIRVPFPTGTVTTRGKESHNSFGTRHGLDIDEAITLEWRQ